MKTKEEIIEIILCNLAVYFESNEDFGPVALACAEEILEPENERGLDAAVRAVVNGQ